MNKKAVAVVFGGYSPEYEVSLNSAHSIINAIDRNKYEVILIGITRQGKWFRYYGPVGDIPIDRWHLDEALIRSAIISPERGGGLLEFDGGRAVIVPIDVVFPVLHGRYGEDGTIQGLCELAGIPVVGAGTASSALCMDKDRAMRLASHAGVKVPEAICFERPPPDEEMLRAAKALGLPLFVKPVKAGSSLGISKVERWSELPGAVRLAFTFDDTVMIEECVEGIEVGCAIVGNHDLRTGRIDEIEVSGGFFDYEEKYSLKTSKIHIPARIDGETEQRLQDAAMTVYRALGCRGYARLDMFLTKEGDIVFIEANTIPGFTPFSQFPRMMKAADVEYPALVEMLIELGIENSCSWDGSWSGG